MTPERLDHLSVLSNRVDILSWMADVDLGNPAFQDPHEFIDTVGCPFWYELSRTNHDNGREGIVLKGLGTLSMPCIGSPRMNRSQQMDNGGDSPAVAIGVLVGLVAAVAAFTLVITGGVYSGEFVDLLPAIGFVFLILAAFLLIRGGGG